MNVVLLYVKGPECKELTLVFVVFIAFSSMNLVMSMPWLICRRGIQNPVLLPPYYSLSNQQDSWKLYYSVNVPGPSHCLNFFSLFFSLKGNWSWMSENHNELYPCVQDPKWIKVHRNQAERTWSNQAFPSSQQIQAKGIDLGSLAASEERGLGPLPDLVGNREKWEWKWMQLTAKNL